MPQTLPVPSKGALRALRRLALGTSCTVAFGVGIVTADRRRRIHTAKVVQENARKLKASRNYHSGGTAVAELLDQRVISYEDSGHWKRANAASREDSESSEASIIAESSHTNAAAIQSPALEARPWTRSDGPRESTWTNTGVSRLKLNLTNAAALLEKAISKPVPRKGKREVGKNQMIQLAEDVFRDFGHQPIPNIERYKMATSALEVIDKPPTTAQVKMAASRFLEICSKGTNAQPLSETTVKAFTIFALCAQADNQLELYTTVIEGLLKRGAMDEASFYALRINLALNHCLQDGIHDIKQLKRAAAIFMTDFNDKPGPMPFEIYNIGIKLCHYLFDAKLYNLTDAVFWRLSSRGDLPFTLFTPLMHANYQMGRYKIVLKQFDRLFTQARPDQETFYDIGKVVIDAAIQQGNLEKAEEAIQALNLMAKEGNLLTSSEWTQNLLRRRWEVFHDLAHVRAAFDRLEPALRLINHQDHVYNTMIEICIKAGNDEAALELRDKIKAVNKFEMRTLGHFAYAKALKNDWAGVEEDFKTMKTSQGVSPKSYNAAFGPVLERYVESHTIPKVEKFIQRFVEVFKVVPDARTSHIMVRMYAKAGEIHSITKWIKYVQSFGVSVDSRVFNALLNNCSLYWKLPFDRLLQLSTQAKALDANLIDHYTVVILSKAAIKIAKGDSILSAQLHQRVKRFSPNLDTHTLVIAGDSGLELQMGNALAKCEYTKVVGLFKSAVKRNIPLRCSMVHMVVNAVFKIDPQDITQAVDFIKLAEDRNVDTSHAINLLLVYQMGKVDKEAANTDIIVKRTMVALAERGFQIRGHTAITAVSTLVHRSCYHEAVDLWKSLLKQDLFSLDLVSLTILLRAYARLKDASGIRWLIETLSRHNIKPDSRFRQVLKNGRRETRNIVTQAGGQRKENATQYLDLLEESLRIVKAMTAENMAGQQQAEEKTREIMRTATATATAHGLVKPRRRTAQSFRPLKLDHDVKIVQSDEDADSLQEMSEWSDIEETVYPEIERGARLASGTR